jgi:ABC-type sulfate transport system permease component
MDRLCGAWRAAAAGVLLVLLLLLLLLLSKQCVVVDQAQSRVFTVLDPQAAAAYRIGYIKCVHATLPKLLYLPCRLLSQAHHTSVM